MSGIRILVAEPENFSGKALDMLAEAGSVACRAIGQQEVRSVLAEYDVLWIRLGLRVHDADIPESPRCRFLVTATTGTDHLSLDALGRAGIRVLCLREEREFLETIGVTAELTLGLILALARRLPAAVNSVALSGRWDRDSFRGVELYGKTAGIVGLGRLGRKMVTFLGAMGMRIVAWDPHAVLTPGVRMAASLDDLLREADVVTVHVPLNRETEGMFDAGRFNAMRPGAFFVNTSRGALVDESALLGALASGRLGGAGLDVLRGEPSINRSHPLVQYAGSHDNLIITPHIGGAVDGVMARCEEHMVKLLQREIKAIIV